MTLQIFAYAGLALMTLSLVVGIYHFSDGPASVRPELGPRGAARRQVMSNGGLFAAIEPTIRFLAARIAYLPLGPARLRVSKKIAAAGDWLGLTADEFFGMCVLSGIAGGLLSYVFVLVAGMSLVFVPMGIVLGAFLPSIEVDGFSRRRHTQISRGLPTAIDLTTMCVGAGLDFPSSLRQVVQNMAERDTGLRREFERILQELTLGRTRRAALLEFAERVPTDPVKEFVGSVTLAEEKGTPLIEVLRLQSGTLRLWRSVFAEEASARAATWMLLPLLMSFACVFLLLLGPLIVNLAEGGI